jgi:hypothetical protein
MFAGLEGPSAELDILNGIMLREEYINRLQEMTKSRYDLLKLVDILDLLRVVGLDIIDCIEKWRNGSVRALFHLPLNS